MLKHAAGCFPTFFRMHLRSLQIFCDVVELGSFSAAGERHALTTTEVSQLIRILEEHAETDLFKRGRKRLLLTREGRRFYDSAGSVLKSSDQSMEREDSQGNGSAE
jgi:DNA-binding transcriptional LysR family regulator